MLQLQKSRSSRRSPITQLSRRATRLVWCMAVLTGADVVWMSTMGEWLDRQPRLVAMMTWGGHYRLVLATAICALVAYALLAPVTRGFTVASTEQMGAIVGTCFVSLLAVTGVLALTAPLLIAGLVIAVVWRLLR
jgi:hypothetical protein